MSEAEMEQIHATIANLNAETAKFVEEGKKLRAESKYEWVKIVAYVVATFTAAFFLAFKIAGII